VTGTPISKAGLQDLHGLFHFLNLYPATSNLSPPSSKLLHRLTSHALALPTLVGMTGEFMHRHMKAVVDGDLSIPPQTEVLVGLELSAVERWYYDTLFDQMVESLQLKDRARSFAHSATVNLGAENATVSEQAWLLRLRQTCCHVQIGDRNRRVFGGHLKSMDQVLEVMLYRGRWDVLFTQRAFVVLRIVFVRIFE
jgi:E3 ubiquitin-protein ligase SHPRH